MVLRASLCRRRYYDAIEAPQKGFVRFEGCHHFVVYNRPDAFLRELLTHVRPLLISREFQTPAEVRLTSGPGRNPEAPTAIASSFATPVLLLDKYEAQREL